MNKKGKPQQFIPPLRELELKRQFLKCDCRALFGMDCIYVGLIRSLRLQSNRIEFADFD